MMQIRKQRYLIYILFFISNSAAYALPENFTANYALYHNQSYIGEAMRKLHYNGDTLSYTSKAISKGFISLFYDIKIYEESLFNVKDKQLKFHSYSYYEKKNNDIKNYQIQLKKNTTIFNSHNNESYPLPANLHDTLGFTVAVMHDLQSGLRDMKYTIAEKDKLQQYHLKFIKTEKLRTSKGQLMTLKMEHYDAQSKTRFTLWCAEEMKFLPVRIRKIDHRGKETLLNLNQYNKKPLEIYLPEEEID